MTLARIARISMILVLSLLLLLLLLIVDGSWAQNYPPREIKPGERCGDGRMFLRTTDFSCFRAFLSQIVNKKDI